VSNCYTTKKNINFVTKDDLIKVIFNVKKSLKLKYGFQNLIKRIFTDKIKYIIISSNCEVTMRSIIIYYAFIKDIKLLIYEGNSLELGDVLSKLWPISIITVYT
jgi:ribosomal protein L30E